MADAVRNNGSSEGRSVVRVLAVGDVGASLPRSRDVDVVARATDIERAIRDADRLQVAVAVVACGGASSIRFRDVALLHARAPRLRIVALSEHTDEERVLGAFRAGARGYVVRKSSSEVLREAIRSVAKGGTYLDPEIASLVIRLVIRRGRSAPGALSDQERRVLEHLPKGMTNREIAEVLGLSENTIKTHVSHILQKLQVRDRVQAASIAVRQGLV